MNPPTHPSRGPRAWLALALVIALTPTFPSASPTSTAGDWPRFLGPHADGTSPATRLAPDWPPAGPPIRWQRPVGQGFASPVVVSNQVLIFHRIDQREIVDCLDATTGSPRWSSPAPATYSDDFGFDEGPRATPAIADGRVHTLGANGTLRALDLASGKTLWTRQATSDFRAPKGFFGFACSPLVDGDLVVYNLGGTDGAGIVALDAATGHLRWKATDHEASYSSPVAATLHGTRHLLVLTRSGLVGLQPATGQVLFEHPWRARMHASVNAATPLVRDNDIFLSASYQTGAILLRLDGQRLTRVWSGDDILSNHYATSVRADGFLYGYDGRQEQGCRLRCVEWATGRVRWTQEGFGAGTVLLAGSDLLLLKENGELIRAPASPEGFRPAARAQILPFGVRAHAALAWNRLYARSKDRLVCVQLGPESTPASSP